MSAAAPDTPQPPAPTHPWWSRAWAAIRRGIKRIFEPVDEPLLPPPPPPPPKEGVTFRQDPSTPILAPAKGGAFDFRVYVALTWKARGIHWDELRARSREFSLLPHRAVARMATDLASTFAPHRAAELETKLNTELAKKPMWFQRRGIDLYCHPEVSVRLDDRLRRHLEPVWEKLVKMEAEHEVNQRRLKLVGDLNRDWLDLLEKLPANPVAPAAARLTDQDFADAVRQLAKDQQDNIGRLTALLESVGENGKVDDQAVSQLLAMLTEAHRRQLGLAEQGQQKGSRRPPKQRTNGSDPTAGSPAGAGSPPPPPPPPLPPAAGQEPPPDPPE